MHRQLVQRLKDRTARVGIVGLGYVGLPLALRFAEVGYEIIGFDTDDAKVQTLNAGESYLAHIARESVSAARARGFKASGDLSQAAEVDAIIICVPTPLNRHREPDLSFVIGTIEALLPHLRAGQVVSLESTSYPGTTDEELKPRIESRGLEVGREIFLCYSPEREDPGNTEYPTRSVPKVCAGSTAACLATGVALYGHAFDQVVSASSTRVAEMAKLLENIHRAVNVGLVNEMKIICDRMGIDVHEVVRIAATKPFGFVPYWPGPGLGGHCIPIDPFYLTWKAREYGVHTRFIELAGEINRAMPEWVIRKVVEALNERGKALKGSRCLVLGVAYKKNVSDLRESPAVELIELLRVRGASVEYSDPYVAVFPRIRGHSFDLKSVPLTSKSLAAYDLVLIATNHDAFDYALIRECAQLIVDTRGVYLDPSANVIKA